MLTWVNARVPLTWNGLAGGNDTYCATLVAINSLLQVAPGTSVFLLRFAWPWPLIGLLYSILVWFASQGRQIGRATNCVCPTSGGATGGVFCAGLLCYLIDQPIARFQVPPQDNAKLYSRQQ